MKKEKNEQSVNEREIKYAIPYEHNLSEATLYTLEIGYQCYLKKLPLDKAINIIKSTKE